MNGVKVLLAASTMLIVGCAAPEEKPARERGWIGGEYKLARKPGWMGPHDALGAFPASLKESYKCGLLVTALSSNTPVQLAGLSEGDLIVELDSKPVMRIKDFRNMVDKREPGTLLPVKAYRNGQVQDFNVPVGRETFRNEGVFAFALPPELRGLDLWPNPDFSLIALGYQREFKRTELGSVQSVYQHECDPNFKPHDRVWYSWLAGLQLWKSDIILSQENVRSPAVRGQSESL